MGPKQQQPSRCRHLTLDPQHQDNSMHQCRCRGPSETTIQWNPTPLKATQRHSESLLEQWESYTVLKNQTVLVEARTSKDSLKTAVFGSTATKFPINYTLAELCLCLLKHQRPTIDFIQHPLHGSLSRGGNQRR